MVQRFISEGDLDTESIEQLQKLMNNKNIKAWELTYSHEPGEVYQTSKTHPRPRKIHGGLLQTHRHSPSSVDAVEDSDQVDTASESEQDRGLPRAGRHCRGSKRKRKGRSSPLPIPKERRPAKNYRATKRSKHNANNDDDEPDELEGGETQLQQIRLDEVKGFYNKSFRSMKQLACKDILKAWIRHGHPQKQTNYPYNGGKSLSKTWRSWEDYGYPGHFTKPDYWPSDKNWEKEGNQHGGGVRHREPDHIGKDERLILLDHLLHCQNKDFKIGNFSIDTLRKATDGIHLKCGDHWKPEYAEKLKEVYRVRELEMEYERDEKDADTLIFVPMPRPKNPKAVKPKPEQLRKEPEQTSFARSDTPLPDLHINLQIEDEYLDSNYGSEPTVLADTSSSTEECAPDASCHEPTLCKNGTVQHGSPSFDSPWPKDRRDRSVYTNRIQEDWIPQSEILGPEPARFSNPDPFGYPATLSEGPRPLPLRGPNHGGSSPAQVFHGQPVQRHNDYRAANPMLPNEAFTHSHPPRPIAPKVQHVRSSTFAASATGMEGWCDADAENPSCQTENYWDSQPKPWVYTANADPIQSVFPSANGSFSSGYSDVESSGRQQLDTWNQMMMQTYPQRLEVEPQQGSSPHIFGGPQYQCLGTNTVIPGGNADLGNYSLYGTPFCTEQKPSPFSHDRSQL